jgi:hypothetical protein
MADQLREKIAIRLQDCIGDHVSFETYKYATDAILALFREEGVDLEGADKRRLDYLDELNARQNEHYGTKYGWRININHNRVALEDHAYPALSVRQAIDAHRPPEPRP